MCQAVFGAGEVVWWTDGRRGPSIVTGRPRVREPPAPAPALAFHAPLSHLPNEPAAKALSHPLEPVWKLRRRSAAGSHPSGGESTK